MKKILPVMMTAVLTLTAAAAGCSAPNVNISIGGQSSVVAADSSVPPSDQSVSVVDEHKNESVSAVEESRNESVSTVEEPAQKTEYTAVALADKSLDEIKEIMGGTYQSEHVQLSNAFSSDGAPYLFNDDALPGFAFLIADNDYTGISVMNGAKLNDSISSDMTYSQIADIVGDLEGKLVGQEFNLVCQTTVDGYAVTFCFIENDYIRQNRESPASISPDVLRGGDPKLQSIGLRRPTVGVTA